MLKNIELLAPGGDVDSIKAAVVAGADAVFCGLNKFNARNRASNISFENLLGIIRLAHNHNCEVFLTLNILVVESELPDLLKLLNRLSNSGIDGVIVQDIGLLYLLKEYFPFFNVHASTQLTTHNKGQIQFLRKLNASRVNLSRELNVHEIRYLSNFANEIDILTEVFVHGSYCLSFSGLCYMSSVQDGKSGNRGRCSQPCRERYLPTSAGKTFPLNLKDNSAYYDLIELYKAGVASLKIEGRIKEFEYVYTVVKTWRKQIDHYFANNTLLQDNGDLYKVFNRSFSNGFLKGNISKDMFIDNPMSHSTKYLSEGKTNVEHLTGEQRKLNLYAEKGESRNLIRKEIELLNIDRIPLTIFVSGKAGEPLRIEVNSADSSFLVLSDVNLQAKGTEALSKNMVLKRLKAINETLFTIDKLDLSGLDKQVYIPFKELTAIKKKLLFVLNDSKKFHAPVIVPKVRGQKEVGIKPKLGVLISSIDDVGLCEETEVTIYFELPNDFRNESQKLIELFAKNKTLIPWFPSVLIGDEYEAAIAFLLKVKPKFIVTNNTGVAFEAHKNNIKWIAGPFLNLTNSYSLLNLKETFNCAGAFISNELSKTQIRTIKKPSDFALYYSIYHPIVLMTSRQCLFHQVSTCAKNKMDNTCIANCKKSASITNLKGSNFLLKKEKGNFNTLYNHSNFLNTEIVHDLPTMFSNYLIDLRNIETTTQIKCVKLELIKRFGSFLDEEEGAIDNLKQSISSSINAQYHKGI